MDDVWFGRGATAADVEACLAALSLGSKPHPPLLAVATDETAPRLVIASRALFALFGAATPETLSQRLLGADDPGARRLAGLCQTLALDGAPRLERLRFFIGPGTEMITFLCRRISRGDTPLFIAAALGLRAGLVPETDPSRAGIASELQPESPAAPIRPDGPAQGMGVQAIRAMLRARWPSTRTLRFLWQADANLICTHISAPLGDIVGTANADLTGRSLLEVAPEIDPSGKLAAALARKETWSGIAVDWPVADAPAAVAVGLGAIVVADRERDFDGYRGYGVIHLDQVSSRTPLTLVAASAAAPTPDLPAPIGSPEPVAPIAVDEPAAPAMAVEAVSTAANVVRFPGAKAWSPEDQAAFLALGSELREETGLQGSGPHPLEPQPKAAPPPPEPTALADTRATEIGRHALAILDRLALGLLVSRDNVPIFANRHLLDTLGFADEDALHEAGGMTHLFGNQPGNVVGSESVGIRHRDGRILPSSARMQTIDWDGLPATLLTLQPASDPAIAERRTEPLPTPAMPGHGADESRELRAILETATDGVVVIDGDDNVLSLNRSGEALLGRDRTEVIGKPFLDVFAPPNRDLAADYLDGLKSDATKRLLNDGREFQVNAHAGQTIPVFMTLGRLGPPHDEAPGDRSGARFCALFRDLTHWKKVERDLETAKQEAERANVLKSEFLAKVGHEIRTPLNSIIGFADVMMEERFGPIGNARYKDYLRDVHASGTHVMSLVNDLLDLSKIEAGKMDLAVDTIDANKIIGECVASMQPQASRARVIMRLSLAPALPQIKADERSLRQIVLNLLSNAVKFNEPGGQVIVATAMPEAGHVVIRVRDTGPGMSEADIAAALEPFRQLQTSRQPAASGNGTNGTGLGLPLTKALVEANQASLTIRSKLDQGTLVEVAFPPARVLAR